MKIEQLKKIFKICNNLGIRTNASMMYGTLGETEEDRKKSEELLEEIKPTFTEINIFVAIPFSQFYEELRQSGKYERMDPVTELIYLKGYKELAERYYGGREDRIVM